MKPIRLYCIDLNRDAVTIRKSVMKKQRRNENEKKISCDGFHYCIPSSVCVKGIVVMSVTVLLPHTFRKVKCIFVVSVKFLPLHNDKYNRMCNRRCQIAVYEIERLSCTLAGVCTLKLLIGTLFQYIRSAKKM